MLLKLIIVVATLCFAPVISSAYYNNEFFPRISKNDVYGQWSNEVNAHSFIEESFSCESIRVDAKSHVKTYDDVTNTKTIKKSPTVVIVPRNKEKQNFLIDVKYADFTGVLDIPDGHSKADCYIIPPYKPLIYIGAQLNKSVIPADSVDIYTLRERDEYDLGTKNNVTSACNKLDIKSLNKCKVVGPPVSYDLPAHPFFLTASRKVKMNDISLLTVVSIERLQRLVDLIENWDGPISVAIEISDTASQLPLFINAWLNTPKMRKNADIHILFNDNFPIVKDSTRPFPINYLRDLALKNTRTNLVLFVEGDYVVNKEFRKNLVKRIPRFLNETHSVFITPAIDAARGIGPEQIPQTKEKLVDAMREPKNKKKFKEKLHTSYKPQNISYWLEQNDIYECKVEKNHIFEPYFVTHRNSIMYDEIFNGCMYDKLSYANNVRTLGFKLNMLPDAFIVHLDHSSLKNYSNWCWGYSTGKRLQLKMNSFNTFSVNLKGFIANSYYPPWLKNGCITETDTYENKNVQKKIIEKRSMIKFLKTCLCLLVIIFGFASYNFIQTAKGKK